jgi:hypothetical protein
MRFHSAARRGRARPGWAGPGLARLASSADKGAAEIFKARRGRAGHGWVWHGKARLGQPETGAGCRFSHGWARPGEARLGMAGYGTALA